MCFCEFNGISRIYLKFVAPRLHEISEAVYDWNQLRVKQNPAHHQIYLDSLMESSFNRISNYRASSNPRIFFVFTTMHHKAKLSKWMTKEKSFPSWCIWADADTCQHWHEPLSKLTHPLHQFHVCVVSLSSGLQCKGTLSLTQACEPCTPFGSFSLTSCTSTHRLKKKTLLTLFESQHYCQINLWSHWWKNLLRTKKNRRDCSRGRVCLMGYKAWKQSRLVVQNK